MVHKTKLIKRLSLPLLVFYGIGTILGAGIYVLVGKVAGEAGMLSPLSFLLAALLAGFSAFSYSELVSRYPRNAGEAVYIQEGFANKKLSIVVGLLIVSVGIISAATLAHGFAGYLNVFFKVSSSIIIPVLIISLGLVCAWGIAQSVTIAAIMTIVEILGLLMIIYVGREVFSSIPVKAPELVPAFELELWQGIFMGSFIAFYAFLGFEDMVNVAEETINPRVNIPRAIIIALVVTTTLYILISLLSVLIIPPHELAASDAPLALIYQTTTAESPLIITVISLVSVLNGAMIQIIMASRVLYGMSSNQWLPEIIGRVNPLTHTPLIATGIVILFILLFALSFPLLSLAKITSFITLVIFMMINFALVKIKIKDKGHVGFTVPLWVPWAGGVLTLLFILIQVVNFKFDM